MRRSSQSPATDSAAGQSARNSQKYVANFQGRSSTSYQEAQSPQYASSPRRSVRNSQQNDTNFERQNSMFEQPTENYDDETDSRKNSVVSPRIRELYKELEATRRRRKYNVERESIRGSQQLAPGLQVMMDLGLVRDTRLTSVDQKLMYSETLDYITSGTQEESPQASESSEIAKTSETPEASEMITFEYPESSETPEPYENTTSEYPDTSEILESSETQEKLYIPRRPEMHGIPKISQRSVMPGRSDMPRCSVMPRKPDVPRSFVMPGRSDIPRCSIIPERSDMPRKSVIPGRSDMIQKSVIPGRSDMPRKSIIPGRSDISRSDMPRKSIISGRSDIYIIDVPRSDMLKKSVISGRSDMPRSDTPQKSVTSGRSDMSRSDMPRTPEMPGSSIMTGRTGMHRRSDMPGRTDMPRSSVMLERSDMPRRSDRSRSLVVPERSERWEEHSLAGSQEIVYSDSNSTVSNASYQPSDTSMHRKQSRVSRVGSILQTKVIEEGKTSPRDLRPTIGFSQDSRRSMLNRVMANWDMEKPRYSEDTQFRQFLDNTVIDWNTVKDPRRKSIKSVEEDSQPPTDSEITRFIGSLLHVVMAGWNSQESKEKIEELLSPKANWSFESLRSEIISLLNETLNDGILENEQERRLKELMEDLQLEESTPYQGERITFSQFRKKIVQEIPKTPQRKRKKVARFTPSRVQIPKTSVFGPETLVNEDFWLTQVPKVGQHVLSLDSEQSFLPHPDYASSMRGSVLYRDQRATRRNDSDYTENTEEGSTPEMDDTVRTEKIYVPSFDLTPPAWTHPDFMKNPENRSMLISTRIEQIQRQQKTLSDIQKAKNRQSTTSESVSSSYGHGNMHIQQKITHPPYSPTPKSGRDVETSFRTDHRTKMRILPEDFKDWLINDTEVRDSADFVLSTPPTDDIEYLESDILWEEEMDDRKDSYLEIEDIIPGRTDSFTEDEGTKSEQTNVDLETEIPVASEELTSAVPEETVSSSQNECIETEKVSPLRKPTIPESEYNMRMKLLPAFRPKKKTVVQARSKNDPKSERSESARKRLRAKSYKIKYDSVKTTVAEMEREQNRCKPVSGKKKTVSPKIKSKPATITEARLKCEQENLDQKQYSGSVGREQPKVSIDSTKDALRKSSIGAETTTFHRLSSSMSPSRLQSGIGPDESRFRLSSLPPNALNRASANIQPGEPRDSTAPTSRHLTQHPLEDLGPRFKYSLSPIVEESACPVWAPSEPVVPFGSISSRRRSTALGSISYPRDSTIQRIPATFGTRSARYNVPYPRDPSKQLLPATFGTQYARNSLSYSRDSATSLVPATGSTRSARVCESYPRVPIIQLPPVTPKKLSTTSAPKTPPCLNSTVVAGTFNTPTMFNTTFRRNQTPFTMKILESVKQNTTIQKISERSYEYASPKKVQQKIKCSDFTEKSSKESLLNISITEKESPRKQTPIKERSSQYTKAKIVSLLNTAMIEKEYPSPKQQHENTTAQYGVDPQQQTAKNSQDSITSATDAATNTTRSSFYEFVCKYHKQYYERATSEDEILTAEMANSQSPQPKAYGLNFLRLRAQFSDLTIPRPKHAELTKIMKEPPAASVPPSEKQAQPSKTPAPVDTISTQLGKTSAMPNDIYAQKTSTDSANKPVQTITGTIKKKEPAPERRKGSLLPMINLGNTATTPEASLATWIRERRTSHAIPIPALVPQNPESLLPPKQRPIPGWRKDERPYRKLQSLVSNTDKLRVRTNTRRTLQNKVIALRRSKIGRQRRLAVPASTLNWRKFMRSCTVYANSRKSTVRSNKFARQYIKSLNETDKPTSKPLTFRQFLIGNVIGQGTFGTVRIAENLYKEEPCAVKMEYISKRKLYLSLENRIYKRLGRAPGFAEIFHFEQFAFNKYNALVMELLGPSLQEIYKKITRFSLKTVLQIINQVLRRVEYIHQKGIIHRDIKPGNFLVGRLGTVKQNTIYMVDFGMAKIYKNARGKHIKYSPAAGRFGTAKYSSINAHLGREHSRRDDLEACGYMFIYFARGSLPWQGLDITSAKQKYKKIGEMKQSTSLESLCEGLPAEFIMYMNYVRRLKFSEDPDYSLLRNMFSELYFRKEYFNRRQFDWTELLENEPDPRLRKGLPGPKHLRPQMQQFYV